MAVPAYCTNVHAGATLDAVRISLDTYACAVRDRLRSSGHLGPHATLPIGAWLPSAAVEGLRSDRSGVAAFAAFAAWLASRDLEVVTLNGFPFSDFHAPRVKHAVYRPDWSDPARREYTLGLVELLAGLSPAETPRSISTLPLGWPDATFVGAGRGEALRRCAGHLLDVVELARGIRERSGRHVRLDLEPEPGCVLERSTDLRTFVQDVLRPLAQERGISDAALRDHLGACLDVCHAAVMFEPAETFVDTVHECGLRVGKVQVSSAPRALVQGDAAPGLLRALRHFGEDRYLHQTMIRTAEGRLHFHEDLPLALAVGEALAAGEADSGGAVAGEWRVHFHVPVFLESIATRDGAALATTRDLIEPAVRATADDHPMIEVETYAWGVLPSPISAHEALAEGIAQELRDTAALLARVAAASRRVRSDDA